MRSRSSKAIFLAAIASFVCAIPAPAQGLLDTLKDVVTSPTFSNYIRSKISPAYSSAYSQPNSYSQGDYQAPTFTASTPAAFAGTPPAIAAPAPANTTPSNVGMTLTKQLAPAELLQLSQYDIDVLVDESGSMSTRDCPDPLMTGSSVSRWDWCRAQSSILTQQTAGVSGISLVPFSDKFARYDNVSPQAINSLFSSNTPGGSTNLALALRQEFDRYLQSHSLGLNRRPLMITVISDGVPDNRSEVYNLIRNASMQVGQNEIAIAFFLIGQDEKGTEFVRDLQRKLQKDGVNTIPITEHSFSEVNQVGLARSLVYSMTTHS